MGKLNSHVYDTVEESLRHSGLTSVQASDAIRKMIVDKIRFYVLPEEESGLVRHARQELELINEDPDVINWFLNVIAAFTEYGHSGYSAAITQAVLSDLLQFKNLYPLTTDPHEWMLIGGMVKGETLYQSRRNPAAFSNDRGKTYWLTTDRKKRFLWWTWRQMRQGLPYEPGSKPTVAP